MTVCSHEVGLAKPDRSIFLLACERLGVEPAEVVVVDDLCANVEDARAVGRSAILHRRTAATVVALDRSLGREAEAWLDPNRAADLWTAAPPAFARSWLGSPTLRR